MKLKKNKTFTQRRYYGNFATIFREKRVLNLHFTDNSVYLTCKHYTCITIEHLIQNSDLWVWVVRFMIEE